MNKHVKDITGQRFGKLKVESFSHVTKTGGSYWNCVCDCGNKTLTRARVLKNDHKRSCGCLVWLRPFESLYNFLIKTSTFRGVENSLSYEDFLEFTKISNCHYCNALVTWAEFNINKNRSAYNLDRKDNNLGYVKDNCLVCCRRCNSGKGKYFTYEQWFEMTKPFRLGVLK